MDTICIIATGRSGTHALRSILRQENWITCLDEVLNPELQRKIPGNITEFLDKMFRLMPDWKLNGSTARYLIKEYFTYLQNIAKDCVPLIDIKNEQLRILDWWLELGKNKPLFLKQIMYNDYPIIQLTRQNVLAQYASIKLAVQTNEWVRNKYKVSKNETPPEYIFENLDKYAGANRQFSNWFSNYPRTACLTYETLLDGARLSTSARTEIERVVGRTLDPTITADTQKIAPPLSQLIKNFDEIKELLKGTPYEKYLDADT